MNDADCRLLESRAVTLLARLQRLRRLLLGGDVLQRVEPAPTLLRVLLRIERLYDLTDMDRFARHALQAIFKHGGGAGLGRLNHDATDSFAILGMKQLEPRARTPGHRGGIAADHGRERL